MGLLEFENINEELEKEIEILSQNYKLYKKEYLLKNPKVLIPMICGIGLDFYSMENSEYFLLKLLVVISLLGMSVRNSTKSRYQLYETEIKEKCLELQDKIRQNEKFQSFFKEYQAFVLDYVAFLNDMNIINPMDVALFYKLCLKGGYLSFYKKNSFKEEDTNEVYLPSEILGCKVTSDTSICRNNASFLTDVMNAKDITSTNLIAKAGYFKISIFPSLFDRKYELSFNHQIVGYIENNELRAYDPTCDLGFNLSELSFFKEQVEIGEEIRTQYPILIYSKTTYSIEEERREQLKEYKKACITKEEWQESKENIKEKYDALEDDLEDFWLSQQEKMKFLSTGYQKLITPMNQKN